MPIVSIPGFSEPFSSLTHLISAGGFAAASFFLIRQARGNCLRVTGLAVYAFTVVYLFSMSGVYHIFEPGGMPRLVFQRLDHSAIWATIAGAFTPIHIILFRGFWRWGVLLLIWAITVTGLVLEVIYLKDIPEFVSLSFYLCLGWMGVLSGFKFLRCYREQSFRFIALGGISFSIGAVMEYLRVPTLLPGIVGPHEVFHIFVIAGVFFHWQFMRIIAGFAITDRLTFLVKVRPDSHIFVTAVTEAIKFEVQSKDEIYSKINYWVARKYPAYTRPNAIKLKYVDEEFIDPGHDIRIAVPVERFFGSLG